MDSTPFAVREAALKVMRSYVGDGPPPVNATGNRRRPWHGGRKSVKQEMGKCKSLYSAVVVGVARFEFLIF